VTAELGTWAGSIGAAVHGAEHAWVEGAPASAPATASGAGASASASAR
jgi:hypothetical protein